MVISTGDRRKRKTVTKNYAIQKLQKLCNKKIKIMSIVIIGIEKFRKSSSTLNNLEYDP